MSDTKSLVGFESLEEALHIDRSNYYFDLSICKLCILTIILQKMETVVI